VEDILAANSKATRTRVRTPALAKPSSEVRLNRPASSLGLPEEENEEANLLAQIRTGTQLLMRAIGTTDADFMKAFLVDLYVSTQRGSTPDWKAAHYSLSLVNGVNPKDPIEAMIGAQMVVVHKEVMRFGRLLGCASNEQMRESYERR